MEKIYEGNLVEIFRVAPNVYFRRADLRTRGQCNGAFIVGETAVAVVDVPTIEGAHELMDEAQKLFGKPIRYIFLTHGDGDHVDGLPVFLEQDVTIFCSKRLLSDLTAGSKQYKATFAGVEGTLPLRLSGGIEVELFTLPDITHSHWDMFIRLPGEKILCVGDAANEFQTLYYHNADVVTWIESLKKLSAADGKYVFPGHGEVYPYSHIGEVADFISVVLRAAENCFDRISDEERHKLSDEKIDSVVADYLSRGTGDAAEIKLKAGADAQREVRMVVRYLANRK